MSEDFWNRRVKVPQIKKINKYITIPAFSTTCGFPKYSRLFDGALGSYLLNDEPNTIIGALTSFALMAWVYYTPVSADSGMRSIFCINDVNNNTRIINIGVEDGFVKVLLFAGGYSTTLFSLPVPSFKWSHIAIRWYDNILYCYVDGVKDSITGVIGGPLTAPDPAGQYNTIGAYLPIGSKSFPGYISNVVFFNTNIEEDNILQDSVRECFRGPDLTASTLDSLMTYQYRLNEETTLIEKLSGDVLTVVGGVTRADEFPIHFNSSFVCNEFSATFSEKFSILFPLEIPDLADFALVVRWLDDNDITQRRVLFTVDGVVFPEIYEDYGGEILPIDAIFEIWNIDGSLTATLSASYNIDVSILTDPTESYDIAQVQEALLVGSSNLASAFPSSFPMTFNTQQVY